MIEEVREKAVCHECTWGSVGPGSRQAAGRHHRDTGHRLTTDATTVYGHVVPEQIEGQLSIDDIAEAA